MKWYYVKMEIFLLMNFEKLFILFKMEQIFVNSVTQKTTGDDTEFEVDLIKPY